jgi:hypothetical protein
MFIFSSQALACFFYLSYGIPNDHSCWVYTRSWGFHVCILSDVSLTKEGDVANYTHAFSGVRPVVWISYVHF